MDTQMSIFITTIILVNFDSLEMSIYDALFCITLTSLYLLRNFRRYIPLRNDICDVKKKLMIHFEDCSQYLQDLEQVNE